MRSQRSSGALGFFHIFFVFFTTLFASLAEALIEENAIATSTTSGSHPTSSGTHTQYGSGGDSVQYHAHRIAGRQAGTPVPTDLGNNQPLNYQLPPGSTLYYSFQALATPQPQPRKNVEDLYGHDILKRQNDEEKILEAATLLSGERGTVEDAVVKRQSPAARMVWVSINSCLMPNFTSPQDRANPPQLKILWHTASGPDSKEWHSIELIEGYAMFNVTTDNSVIIQIISPQVGVYNESPWNYDLAASRDGPYHSLDDTNPVSLKLIDSDPHAALLITEGLANWTAVQPDPSSAHLDYGPPLGIFANNINYTGLAGMTNSFCAISAHAQIQGYVHPSTDANNGVEMGLTYAQPSNVLEEQFYLPGLNRSSVYLGRLATRNATTAAYREAVVGGGGVLYPFMNFTTKYDENCAVIYNLTFCNQVNYAVPSNPSRHSSQNLAALYDNTTYSMYQNFSYSLQQIPCNTTPTAQYSLSVNCTDCQNAYKSWLCAVTIPKCEDFSSNYNPNFLDWDGAPSAIPTNAYTYDPSPTASDKLSASASSSSSASESASRFQNAIPSASPQPHKIATTYLFPRNLAQQPVPNSSYDTSIIPGSNSLQQMWMATNSSRNNATIGEIVQPGPYMEVLPCNDLCYDLVRMCPAALGFTCPTPGSWLEAMNYGVRGVGKDGAPTCNAPGAVYYPNAAGRTGPVRWLAITWFCVIAVLLECW